MEVIKKVTTVNNLSFNLFLTQNIKNLGLAEDLSENTTIQKITSTLTGNVESKLADVRSYDYNTPYIVGVNGVTKVTATSVQYVIADVTYETNLVTNETTFSIIKQDDNYIKNNFVRTDQNIGLADKVIADNEIDIERSNISVIESFSKLQQIGTPDEIYGFGNNYYKVYDQTL